MAPINFFVRAVLDIGGSLEAVLPAPDYRTKIKSDNLTCYDALLAAAKSVHVLPFERSQRESYMAASEYLLSHVDELVGVWDVGPSGGLGGTAEFERTAARSSLGGHGVEFGALGAPNTADTPGDAASVGRPGGDRGVWSGPRPIVAAAGRTAGHRAECWPECRIPRRRRGGVRP